MAVSYVGLRLKCDCSGKAQNQLYSKLQTRFLVREDALIAKRPNCQTKEEEQDKIWSSILKGGPIPRRTGRLTVGRKKNSNSTLFLGDINTGSLKLRTVKYSNESCGTPTGECQRWRGPVAIVNYRPVLSSEKTHKTPQMSESEKILVMGPRWMPDKTDRNLTLTLIQSCLPNVRSEFLYNAAAL
jgi:hypothetical protein